jgi:hypothetical protein
VITITPVAGLSEALRLANESGCDGASIYGSPGSVLAALEPLTSGTFRINDPDDAADTASAGLGLPAGVRALLNGIAVRDGDARASPKRIEAVPTVSIKPWWFPYLERNRGCR